MSDPSARAQGWTRLTFFISHLRRGVARGGLVSRDSCEIHFRLRLLSRSVRRRRWRRRRRSSDNGAKCWRSRRRRRRRLLITAVAAHISLLILLLLLLLPILLILLLRRFDRSILCIVDAVAAVAQSMSFLAAQSWQNICPMRASELHGLLLRVPPNGLGTQCFV